MDTRRLDQYVLGLLEKNGWHAGRRFEYAEGWLAEIGQYGYQPFDAARQIVRELGGLAFREYAPLTYQKMIELKQKEGRQIPPGYADDIRAACESCTRILEQLGMQDRAGEYSGATFDLDALSAAKDGEIVLDAETVRGVVKERIFPIGAAAPDGIIFVGEGGRIYTVFNDSIYLSGERIEDFLNMMFVRSIKPKVLYQI